MSTMKRETIKRIESLSDEDRGKVEEFISTLSGDAQEKPKTRVVFYTRLFGGYGHDTELRIRKERLQKVMDEHPEWELGEIYTDNRITNDCREGLQQLIEDAENGKFDLVVINDLNEFDDSIEDSVRLIKNLKKLPEPVSVFVISCGFSSIDPAQGLLMDMIGCAVIAERENVSDIKGLWAAVCSNDQELIKKYFENTDERNIRYSAFGRDHSLIMGAYRNGFLDMCDLLISYGETVTDEEKEELLEPERRRKLISMLGIG